MAAPAEKATAPTARDAPPSDSSIPQPTAAAQAGPSSTPIAGASAQQVRARARGRAIPSMTANTIASTGGFRQRASCCIDQKVGRTTIIVAAPERSPRATIIAAPADVLPLIS